MCGWQDVECLWWHFVDGHTGLVAIAVHATRINKAIDALQSTVRRVRLKAASDGKPPESQIATAESAR